MFPNFLSILDPDPRDLTAKLNSRGTSDTGATVSTRYSVQVRPNNVTVVQNTAMSSVLESVNRMEIHHLGAPRMRFDRGLMLSRPN